MTDDTDPERLAGSHPPLVERIRSELRTAPAGRIPFARFMELALTAPGLGYYATRDDRPTREGDFLSAPELHPFFGRCLARHLADVWERLGRPSTFTVVEHGAGKGTLRSTVRAGLVADRSELASAVRWVAVDLPARSDTPPTEPFAGAVLANEYLDALPVHRLEREDGCTLERWVTWRDGWFTEVTAELSEPGLERSLTRSGVTLADGQVADIAPGWETFPEAATRHLERGELLVIDYGHPAPDLFGPRRMAGTLLGYRDHRVVEDPLAGIGLTDLTAHVDLTAVARGAERAGLEAAGWTTQARFLVDLGLGDLLRELGQRPDADAGAYLEARAAVARFLDPRHLGAFRVLAFGRALPTDPPLAGFRGG